MTLGSSVPPSLEPSSLQTPPRSTWLGGASSFFRAAPSEDGPAASGSVAGGRSCQSDRQVLRPDNVRICRDECVGLPMSGDSGADAADAVNAGEWDDGQLLSTEDRPDGSPQRTGGSTSPQA